MRRIEGHVLIAFLGACGGSGSSDGPDATSEAAADGATDANGAGDAGDASLRDAATDGTVTDALPEAGGEGGGECANPDASGCYQCCAAAHQGSGFELIFFQQCEGCGAPPSSCTSTKICDPTASALPTGPCFACLDPTLNTTASGWQQCQNSAACPGFVTCIKGCPTQ